MRLKNGDKLIILILFLLTIFSFNVKSYFGDVGKEAHVFINGEFCYKIALDDDKEYKISVINGVTTIRVANNKLYIDDAPCPLKICMKESPISKEGESLVCVPNMMIVKIQGEEQEKLDSVTK